MVITEIFNGEHLVFTSDLHYGHANILKFSYLTRSMWKTVSEMDQGILDSLRNGIDKDDVWFDLGDMFWRTPDKEVSSILNSVPHKALYKILGNHDSHNLWKKSREVKDLVTEMGDIFDIRVSYGGNIYTLVLSHYPLLSWNHKSRGSLMIHGHCHGNIDAINTESPDLRVDIGLDGLLCSSKGEAYITFKDILEYFLEKTGGNQNFKQYSLSKCKETI